MGSLARRFRNCLTGIRAQQYAPGAPSSSSSSST